MFEIEFKYSKLGPKHCVYVSLSQQNGWLLRVQVTIFVTGKLNTHLSKKMRTSICVKKIHIIKFFEIYGWFFFPTKDFSRLESCQLHIIAKYKASNCCKMEAVIQRYSLKKMFLKILENSRENPCARASFLIKLQLKKRLRPSYFPVNIANFLRTPFFIQHFRWFPQVN